MANMITSRITFKHLLTFFSFFIMSLNDDARLVTPSDDDPVVATSDAAAAISGMTPEDAAAPSRINCPPPMGESSAPCWCCC